MGNLDSTVSFLKDDRERSHVHRAEIPKREEGKYKKGSKRGIYEFNSDHWGGGEDFFKLGVKIRGEF